MWYVMKLVCSFLCFFPVWLFSFESLASGKVKLGDIEEERKNAPLIFPEEFKTNGLKYTNDDLMKHILQPAKVASESGLWIGRFIQRDNLFIYESKTLRTFSQLGSNSQYELRQEFDHKVASMEIKKWHFKVTTQRNNDPKDSEIHTFLISLLPFDKVEKLPAKEKDELNHFLLAQRNVQQGRPRSATADTPYMAKGMIEEMYRNTLNSHSLSSSQSPESPKEKIPEKPKEQSMSHFSLLKSTSQSKMDKRMRKSTSMDTVVTSKKDYSQGSPPAQIHQFKLRLDEWKKAKDHSLPPAHEDKTSPETKGQGAIHHPSIGMKPGKGYREKGLKNYPTLFTTPTTN